MLVSAQQLTQHNGDSPLAIHDYKFTDDRKRVLIFTNSEKVWRLKTRGDYWVLDLASGSLKQIGGPEAGSASRTSVTARVIAATVSAGTRSLKKGMSP